MFLESPRFPTDVSFEQPGGPGYNTDVVVLESAFEQRNQFWSESRGKYDVGYDVRELDKVTQVVEHFHAVGGREHGFRYKDWQDFLSVRRTQHPSDAISATDQVISIDTTTTDAFQLIKTYYKGFLARRRTIAKPIADTVEVAIQGIVIPTTRYDLLYVPTNLANEGHETIGRVTLATNIQRTVIGITNAASAVVETSAAHGLAVNDSVHFSSVGGMTEINGKRGLVTNIGDTTHFTVAINSSAFGVYTSGGQINTQRQSTSFSVTVTGITKHARALVTHSGAQTVVPGDVGVITGVNGMTEINDMTVTVRQVVDSTHFRINVNTVEFGTYTNSGSIAFAERVTAGFEFDVPVRFDVDDIPMTFTAWEAAGVNLPIVELRVV